ncbi:MAG: carbohydrate kinase family protein, partial [Hadesarchaea archaeon]|nr:carbohydrate kinase family protein [Hadesarchaea archaeon]
ESTGIAFILTSSDRGRFLIEYRGANEYLSPNDLVDDYLEGGDVIHASSVNPEMALAIGSKAKELGLKASLDLGAELTHLSRPKLLELLNNFDICFMNEETFESIFNIQPTELNVLRVLPEDLEVLSVTLGAEGAIAANEDEAVSSSSYEVKVKDTTGAGDAFAAAFNKFLLDGASLQKCVNYGVAEAAIKVQNIGARENLPTLDELKEFIDRHEK